MKLGDSLGRNRRRRGKAKRGADEAPVRDDTAGDAGVAAAGHGGHDAERTDGASESTPGSSSSTSGSTAPKSLFPALQGRNLLIGAAALAIFGWIFGYGIATRVLFPAPPPPGDLFEVPDLRGMGLASASERLAGVGLELGGVDSLRHPSVSAGLILGQSPLPGQLARPVDPVRVTLSTGPERRSVPDVTSLDEARARTVLETSGFVVNVVTVENERPRGQVVSVNPPPDSVVALPAEVRLAISAGPPVVAMPLVLGLELTEAEHVLDSLGLVVSDVEEVFRFGRDQGIVVEQEPAADTEMERGSRVRLKVGRGGREGGSRREQ